ncbi:MAG: hypothetical protein JWP81_654 [Ferruginibacter sp.]|nr:hypothetical protein [Ferruginibacter sp.]
MIREAGLGDLDELIVLFDNYRIFYEKTSDIIASGNFLKARMENKDSKIFVAENEDGMLTGFVQLYPIFSSTRLKPLWLLNDLFVEPEHRGKKISVALIDRCKILCQDTNSCGMILETAKDNVIGNHLYLKNGFLPDSNHNYYEWEFGSA